MGEKLYFLNFLSLDRSRTLEQELLLAFLGSKYHFFQILYFNNHYKDSVAENNWAFKIVRSSNLDVFLRY